MKLTQAEKDRLMVSVVAKNEPIYQTLAYLKLVKTPLTKINDKLLGEVFTDNLIGELNEFIKGEVKAWFEENYRCLPIVARSEDFVWSLRINEHNDGLEFDKFPAILKQLEEGKANLRLFSPSPEVLESMLEQEAALSIPVPVNAEYVGGGIYIVRTQAGFNKAIKEHLGPEYVSEVDSYPTTYPALVSLTLGYRGSDYTQVRWVPLNTLKDALYKQGEL